MEKGISGSASDPVLLGEVLAKRSAASAALFQFPELYYTHAGSLNSISS